MGLSKSTRIIILLTIDTAFFLLELIVGYAVHSLALVADAFHMLNDVLSLCVGLWAVKVANSKSNADMYTYGWQRAETLGALLNGVFLVALCVSIFLEAIQRFVEPQEISNPKLVLIVGCLGLASNLLGLLLFHEHGHSHGAGGHSHGSHGDGIDAAEEGHAHSHANEREVQAADESGNVADVLPQNRLAGWPRTKTTTSASSEQTVAGSGSPLTTKTSASSKHTRAHKHSRSASRPMSGPEDIPVNPSYIRRSIIDAGRRDTLESDDSGDDDAVVYGNHRDEDDTHDHAEPEQPLLHSNGGKNYGTNNSKRKPADHSTHNHRQPKEKGSGGHGHGHDLNMRGILLHVIGDALGNIGVIGTALFIWLTNYSWRFYADPLISLIITAIILTSAIPLCKAASRILLQAVPSHISVDDIRKDIESLDGVLACHDLHVWQLSDTKLIASLHIRVAMDFKNEDAGRYMDLAREIRDCFHEYDIHSVTIQPEFCLDEEHNHSQLTVVHDHDDHNGHDSSAHGPSRTTSKAGSVCEPQACLLDCDRSCGPDKSCCGPAKTDHEDDHHGHNHTH